MMRPEDASCAICMDSLFHKKDDLDEICHIAAPDCGHVFHEECLQQWFTSQAQQYIAQQREYRNRSLSPSTSEAPAECPTCRQECYADPETGEANYHRLFINFSNPDGSFSCTQTQGPVGGSSTMGSSPWRKEGSSRKGKEKERGRREDEMLMGFARRAKGLGEEFRSLNAESEEDEVAGTTNRVDGLRGDLASQKSIDAIKKYVGGLTTAINNFRSSLETHPLMSSLQAQLLKANEDIRRLKRSQADFERINLPLLQQRIEDSERKKAGVRVKKAEQDLELVKGELNRESVQRRTLEKSLEEHRSQWKKEVEALKKRCHEEEEERSSLASNLAERTRQLKRLQLKLEEKNDLKTQLKDLEAENQRLKSNLSILNSSRSSRPEIDPSRSSSSHTKSSSRELDIDVDDSEAENAEEGDLGMMEEGDSSIQEISPNAFRSSQLPSQSRLRSLKATEEVKRLKDKSRKEDDSSLSIEMPSSLLFVDNPVSERPRQHPTKRVLDSDQFDTDTKRKSSKYFDEARIAIPSSSSTTAHHSIYNPTSVSAIKSKTNPFSSDKNYTEKKKQLKPSTSISRAGKEPVLMDISSSPERNDNTLKERNHNGGDTSATLHQTAVGRSLSRDQQRSMVDFLGLTDKDGKLKKGVASGAKVKRKL